ncbi:MAG: MBL fold metallo-hydrolase, partial [Gammaproteobacteria bacterium]
MTKKTLNFFFFTILALFILQQAFLPALATTKSIDKPLALQVLGSGGPNDVDGRASSSYLIWLDGKAKIMVDAGGGASLRFGESGANIEDLEVMAISHLHVDHSIDVATMI